MKLSHVKLDITLNFDESNRILSWIIQDPQTYYAFIQELLKQIQGETGQFVLSNNDKNIKIDSDVQPIVGPFDISLNSKKITAMISKNLLKLAVNGEYSEQFKKLSETFKSYLDEVILNSDLPVEIDELQEENIFKVASIKSKESTSFYENLINYISLILKLARPKLLILIDITRYIGKEQMNEFLNFLMYEDVNVLFIDLLTHDGSCSYTKTYFLDSDNCEFEYTSGTFNREELFT